jgi:hypothetical protein
MSLCHQTRASVGLDEDLRLELHDLESCAMERFKHEVRYQKFLELDEKIKTIAQDKDKRNYQNNRIALVSLNKELKALNYDPSVESANVIALETLQSRVQEAMQRLEERENLLLLEDDLEASMLCEVSRLNLLNFLKVFQVEMDLEPELGPGDDNQLISRLRGEVKTLSDKVIVLRSEKIVQV